MRSRTRPAAKVRPREEVENLFRAILQLKTVADVDKFLKDLCTTGELGELIDRWWIARLLDKGEKSQSDISKIVKVSETTVSRVMRTLDDDVNGYRLVLDRLSEENGSIAAPVAVIRVSNS